MRTCTPFCTNAFIIFLHHKFLKSENQSRSSHWPSTGKWLIVVIGIWLSCIGLASGQSSDCEPGNVHNGTNDAWSEQCYLANDCQEQGNPCQANDVRMLGVFVANATGGPVPTCVTSDPVQFYLWGLFSNNTNSNRYAVRTVSELFINNNFELEINQCSFDQLAPGETQVILLNELTYTCGDQMELKNTWVGWDTSPRQCGDPSGSDYDCCCVDYPPAKCSKTLESVAFLVPNFAAACDGIGQNQTHLCINNLTYGGTQPLTFSCDFGDGFTSSSPNPCHTYSADSGTFIVVLTATDANGITASATDTITLEALDCCQLTYTCPPENGGLFSCVDDIPAPDENILNVTNYCGTLFIDINDTSVGGGCPADTLVITRTYSLEDEFSSETCVQIFKVVNNIPPAITCPANVTVSCAGQVPLPNLNLASHDHCGEPVTVSHVSDITTNINCSNQFIITRTYSAIDACGNIATCQQIITVNDNIAPSITCPDDLTVACASEVPPADIAIISASDNCTGTPVITVIPDVITNLNCTHNYTITRVYIATDACGNSSTCAQLIHVNDTIPPAIACPVNLTVACDEDIPPANTSAILTTDNCSGTIEVFVASELISNFVCDHQYTLHRIYSAVDLCGNTATCVQTITVHDQTAPAITCPASVTVSCSADVPLPNIGSIGSTDNCDGPVAITVAPDITTHFECANNYTLLRIYTATDGCGNTNTCSQTITVHDTTPPSIICPVNITVSCSADVPSPDPAAIITSDNCGGTDYFVTDVVTNQTCANTYIITRVYTALDDCGNTATCSQSITVMDNTEPTITCLPDITVDCPGNVPAPNVNTIETSDNCDGAVTVTVAADVTIDLICPQQYAILRTYWATDVCGNSTSCTQTILVHDTIAPSITCPSSVTVDCDNIPGPAPQSVSASDNCGGTVIVTFAGDVTTNITCANAYNIQRTYLATDPCGNTAACIQTIIVQDQTTPAITCPANVTVACSADIPLPDISLIGSVDNCDGPVTITVAPDVTTDFTCANNYTLLRIYTSTDDCGNTATCSQTITVFDLTPPSIICPANLTVTCSSEVPDPNTAAVVTSDNCLGGITVTVEPDDTINTICLNNYVVERTYHAVDACGNSASCIQSIYIIDTIPPQIVCPHDLSVLCGENLPLTRDQ
jgi:hypothetical protein